MKRSERSAWLTSLALLVSSLALRAEEPAVVKDAHVNVRGQPSLAGEVITQLQQGEKVVILEEITLAKPKTNEPPRWARIQMPANTPVWVYAPFLDSNKVVKVSRLNLRAGPGENFSVVGRLQRGNPINEIRRTGDWIEIETPPSAYGFVAAELLTKGQPSAASPAAAQSTAVQTNPAQTNAAIKPLVPETAPKVQPQLPPPIVQKPAATAPSLPGPGTASNTVTLAKTDGTPVASTTVKAASPTLPPGPPPTTTFPSSAPPAVSSQTVVRSANLVTNSSGTHATLPPASARAELPVPKADEAKPGEGLERRIVRREGLVRSTASIQAPTYYELLNPDNRRTINYLHTDALGLKLNDYRGRRIVVTGEEAIDPRWPRTPVIEVQSLQLIP
jgi:uncharacterized protein YgiM (DUF1202 family)